MTLDEFVKRRKELEKLDGAVDKAYASNAEERIAARDTISAAAREIGGDVAQLNWDNEESVKRYLPAVLSASEDLYASEFDNDVRGNVEALDDSKLADAVGRIPAGDGDDLTATLTKYEALKQGMGAVLRGEREYSEVAGAIVKEVERDLDNRFKEKGYDGRLSDKTKKLIKGAVTYTVASDPRAGRDVVNGLIEREKNKIKEELPEEEDRAALARDRIYKLADSGDAKKIDAAREAVYQLAA